MIDVSHDGQGNVVLEIPIPFADEAERVVIPNEEFSDFLIKLIHIQAEIYK
jgi:hypothetical protein